MPNAPDVIAFVRARVAEREDAALHALGMDAALAARRHVEGRPPVSTHPVPTWRQYPGEAGIRQADPDGDAVVVAEASERQATHIVMNDPVAVLQLCHALREALQVAEGTATAAASLADAAPGTREERQLHGAAAASRRIARRLARAWREHPDYLPQWEMDL